MTQARTPQGLRHLTDARMDTCAFELMSDAAARWCHREGRFIIRPPLPDASFETPLSPPRGENRSHLR